VYSEKNGLREERSAVPPRPLAGSISSRLPPPRTPTPASKIELAAGAPNQC